MAEDAAELRQKAERWRVLALGLNDPDDWQRIVALAAELEGRADALAGAAGKRVETAGGPDSGMVLPQQKR
jgi:hypothetical protein